MRHKTGKSAAWWQPAVPQVLLALAGCVTLSAQSALPAPASVSGVVINSVTGNPILRAHVLLQGLGETTNYIVSGAGMRIIGNSDSDWQDYGALTNGEGKFSIASLPPGKYFVSAERLGFVASVNLPSDANTLVLAAGDKKQDLKVKLIPAGVIAGRILDADGEPVSNAEVTAEGARGSSQARTGEQGQYRIGALYPGKYRIRAMPQRRPFGAEIRSDGSREVHYGATYYPDSLARSSARTIDVEPASQLSGIDIRLVGTPDVFVSGNVTGLPENTRGQIEAIREGGRQVDGWPANSVKADGTFTIVNLDPGKYTLVVNAHVRGPQPNLQSAPVEIEVAGANIEHLELRMIAPFEVTGQIRFDDAQIRFPKPQPRPPAVPDNLPDDVPPPSVPRMIRLQPLSGYMQETANADVGADDSFTLEKVMPGRYHVMLDWGSGYVRSVRAGSIETEGDILNVSNGAAGEVVVSVSSLTCEISGTVNDVSGPVANAHVVLAPGTGTGPFSRSTSTKSDGTYSFTGVPPGKFQLAVTEDELYLNFMQPGEALEDYQDVVENIELHPGDKLTKDLKRK